MGDGVPFVQLLTKNLESSTEPDNRRDAGNVAEPTNDDDDLEKTRKRLNFPTRIKITGTHIVQDRIFRPLFL